MAATKDLFTPGGSASATSLTFSHTCTGSELVLYVSCAFATGTGASGVTYNGVAMSKLVSKTHILGDTQEIWRLINPATGAHNVVISHTGSTVILGSAYSATGVDQTTPETYADGAIGAANASVISITATTSATDLILDACCSDSLKTWTAGADQNKLGEQSNAFEMVNSDQAGSAGGVMSWTINANDAMAIVAVSIKSSTGGGGGSTPSNSSLTLTGVGT